MIRQMLPNPVFRRMFTALILTSAEAFLAVLALLAGIPILLNPTALAPTSILALLPVWAIMGWGAGMTIGGFASFIGIILEEYRLERIGVLALGSTVFIFSLALINFFPGSLFVFVTYVLFGLAMAARYWVLGKLIKIRERVNAKPGE